MGSIPLTTMAVLSAAVFSEIARSTVMAMFITLCRSEASQSSFLQRVERLYFLNHSFLKDAAESSGSGSFL